MTPSYPRNSQVFSLDPADGSILARWRLHPHRQDIPFLIRYKEIGTDGWTYQRSRGPSQRLALPALHNNEQIELQVRTDERTNDHWSDPLLITVHQKTSIEGVRVTDEQLLPPLNFKATIKDPHAVKLEWEPAGQDPSIFYLVHVKQMTSRSGVPLHRQQIKTAATSFELGGLEGGARYELAVRSAVPSKISHTAAIVDISMPRGKSFRKPEFG
ncbi:unnamed protein product, partial [Mesorhabditis spiculigera]